MIQTIKMILWFGSEGWNILHTDRQTSRLTFSDSFQLRLYLENLTDMLFSALLNIQDDVQDGSNNMVGNHMVFAMIHVHCTEK